MEMRDAFMIPLRVRVKRDAVLVLGIARARGASQFLRGALYRWPFSAVPPGLGPAVEADLLSKVPPGRYQNVRCSRGRTSILFGFQVWVFGLPFCRELERADDAIG